MKDDHLPGIIIQDESMSMAVQEAQLKADLKNAAKRHAERMEKYTDWVKPEEIAKRWAKHEEGAAAALALAKSESAAAREALGLPAEDPPLPDEKDLPKHMRGQSPSTIRAMLRQEKGWIVEKGLWTKRTWGLD